MKKIATILLLLFVLVQLAPAVCTMLQMDTALFIVDEEKSPEKRFATDCKDVKHCTPAIDYNDILENKLSSAFQLSEDIRMSPCLEKFIPPPNFS